MRTRSRRNGNVMGSVPTDPNRGRAARSRLSLPLTGMIATCALAGCHTSEARAAVNRTPHKTTHSPQQERDRMWMSMGERRFAISLADTNAARTFARHSPLALAMNDLNGNERRRGHDSRHAASASRP
ncbi:MAG: cyclophilin-like fold protein [Luteimonas sp.]